MKFQIHTLKYRAQAVLKSPMSLMSEDLDTLFSITSERSTLTTLKAKQVWEATLGQLQLQVTRPSYETWLKGTVGVAYRDGHFVVGTPNAFVAEMLEQRMYSLISQAMERVTKGQIELEFHVLPTEAAPNQSDGSSIQTIAFGDVNHHTNNNSDETPAPLKANGTPAPDLFRAVAFNHRYTFDAFIVGKSNELAQAAAAAVADKPGVLYNPLVIYSDVGLGKTHLLHAICHRIRAKGLSLIYATTEEFTNEYIKAIRGGTTEEFRGRYRRADALLLDDIQFLIGKEQTQEGFFHTFNALYLANRQIVITSDRPATALTLLERRIRSRLSGGLVVDIQPPGLETRVAILRAKAELMGHNLSTDVLQFLGESMPNNIRELEGGLVRLLAYTQLTRSAVNVDLVKRAVADAVQHREHSQPTPDAILDAVAHYFNVDKAALTRRGGTKAIAHTRHVAMFLIRAQTNLTVAAIGRILGGRRHPTVIHGCNRIADLLTTDASLQSDIATLRNSIS